MKTNAADLSTSVKLWENWCTRTVWVIRVRDNVALRSFATEQAARQWCGKQGAEIEL